MDVIAKQPIKHNGKDYEVGAVVSMSEEDAKSLVDAGYAEVTDNASESAEDAETVKEANAKIETLETKLSEANGKLKGFDTTVQEQAESLKKAETEIESLKEERDDALKQVDTLKVELEEARASLAETSEEETENADAERVDDAEKPKGKKATTTNKAK